MRREITRLEFETSKLPRIRQELAVKRKTRTGLLTEIRSIAAQLDLIESERGQRQESFAGRIQLEEASIENLKERVVEAQAEYEKLRRELAGRKEDAIRELERAKAANEVSFPSVQSSTVHTR